MTDDKIRYVLDLYERELIPRRNAIFDADSIRHLLEMIPRIRGFLTDGRHDKVFRWLGFMQGVLWHLGIYTLEELKTHNREDVNGEEAKQA